jgi:hypothetical protein
MLYNIFLQHSFPIYKFNTNTPDFVSIFNRINLRRYLLPKKNHLRRIERSEDVCKQNEKSC